MAEPQPAHRPTEVLDAGDGVSLDVEGDLTDLSASPRGTLRGTVAADTSQGIAVLAGLSAWPTAMRPAEPAAAIAPLRIAGTVAIGEAGAVDIAGDGTVANASIKVRSRFDRGIAQWKSAGLDVSLAVDGPDAERVARALAGHPAPSSAPQSPRSRLTLRTSGTAANGLATYARIERAGSQASFTGRVTALDPIKASGDVQWSSPDGADLQALLPDLPRVRLEGVATRGAAQLDYTAAAMTLSRINASIDEC